MQRTPGNGSASTRIVPSSLSLEEATVDGILLDNHSSSPQSPSMTPIKPLTFKATLQPGRMLRIPMNSGLAKYRCHHRGLKGVTLTSNCLLTLTTLFQPKVRHSHFLAVSQSH